MQRFFKDLKRYYRYILYASKSELKSEVSYSYLNWLWWILEPVLFMLIYVFVVRIVFRTSEKYFPVFVLIGQMVWMYFNRTVKRSVKIVKSYRSVITKIYVPKFVFTLINMFVNSFKMFISFLIIIVMMLVSRVPLTWNILYFLPVVFVLNLVIFGICMILMHYGVYIGDLNNLINVLLRFIFYLSGIFYSVKNRVPAPYNKFVLKLNPIAFLIDQMRDVLIYGKKADLRFLVIWSVTGLLLSIVGIWKVYKNENSYAKVI
ncbi:MAG: ABC transporter permease [Oscillospiraceae bacterium]|jgi:teichoic acid transport system permease protein|nr:ABC transporter permease [Oscillospiraceae bacterium]